jgi:ribosome modulation factor
MTAWAEGYHARLLFRLVRDCPYQFGSWRAVYWCRGWAAARREEAYPDRPRKNLEKFSAGGVDTLA